MSESLLLHVERARARATLEAIESWPAHRASAQDIRDREEVIDLLVELADEMVGLYQREREQAVLERNRSLAELRQDREWLDEIFHHIRAAISNVAEGIELFTTQTGHVVKGIDRLGNASDILDGLIVRLRDEWPVATQAEVEQALAAAARGEAVDLDEAFAQIAGADKDAWLQRVAEHKRRGQQTGGE